MAEQRCHVSGSCSDDEPADRHEVLDIEAFIDQEFDSIVNYSDDEISNVHMCQVFDEFEKTTSMENYESVCKCKSVSHARHCDCDGLHADSGSIVQELHSLQKDSLREGQRSEKQKEMGDSITTFEMCRQRKSNCNSPSEISRSEMAKMDQNGKLLKMFILYKS